MRFASRPKRGLCRKSRIRKSFLIGLRHYHKQYDTRVYLLPYSFKIESFLKSHQKGRNRRTFQKIEFIFNFLEEKENEVMSGSVGLKLFDLLDQPGNNRCADCGCDGMLISKSYLFFWFQKETYIK